MDHSSSGGGGAAAVVGIAALGGQDETVLLCFMVATGGTSFGGGHDRGLRWARTFETHAMVGWRALQCGDWGYIPGFANDQVYSEAAAGVEEKEGSLHGGLAGKIVPGVPDEDCLELASDFCLHERFHGDGRVSVHALPVVRSDQHSTDVAGQCLSDYVF